MNRSLSDSILHGSCFRGGGFAGRPNNSGRHNGRDAVELDNINSEGG